MRRFLRKKDRTSLYSGKKKHVREDPAGVARILRGGSCGDPGAGPVCFWDPCEEKSCGDGCSRIAREEEEEPFLAGRPAKSKRPKRSPKHNSGFCFSSSLKGADQKRSPRPAEESPADAGLKKFKYLRERIKLCQSAAAAGESPQEIHSSGTRTHPRAPLPRTKKGVTVSAFLHQKRRETRRNASQDQQRYTASRLFPLDTGGGRQAGILGRPVRLQTETSCQLARYSGAQQNNPPRPPARPPACQPASQPFSFVVPPKASNRYFLFRTCLDRVSG